MGSVNVVFCVVKYVSDRAYKRGYDDGIKQSPEIKEILKDMVDALKTGNKK